MQGAVSPLWYLVVILLTSESGVWKLRDKDALGCLKTVIVIEPGCCREKCYEIAAIGQ